MGLLEILTGKRKLAKPAADRLFACVRSPSEIHPSRRLPPAGALVSDLGQLRLKQSLTFPPRRLRRARNAFRNRQGRYLAHTDSRR